MAYENLTLCKRHPNGDQPTRPETPLRNSIHARHKVCECCCDVMLSPKSAAWCHTPRVQLGRGNSVPSHCPMGAIFCLKNKRKLVIIDMWGTPCPTILTFTPLFPSLKTFYWKLATKLNVWVVPGVEENEELRPWMPALPPPKITVETISEFLNYLVFSWTHK